MSMESKQLAEKFAAAKVVVVDDEQYMRKVVRTMLMSIGVREVHEAPDGPSGLDMIRRLKPDVVILDRQMPGLDGPGFVRMVRSPETFPFPDVPIIMLTGHGERSHVIEAVKLGVNEFLLKPVSVKALQDRMIVGPYQTAPDHERRRLLRPGAAQAGRRHSRRQRPGNRQAFRARLVSGIRAACAIPGGHFAGCSHRHRPGNDIDARHGVRCGDLRPLAVAQQELRQIYPAPAQVEHDPEEIWTATLASVRGVMAKAGLAAKDIAGIGIANQRETTVIWDRATGKPIHDAIVWQDRRTADYCDALRSSGHEPQIAAKTGLLLDPYFSASKIAWLLDHVEGARHAAEAGKLAFGTIDCFLLWRLTGGKVHATDATNAARTSLFDISRGLWDDDLCRLFGVPHSLAAAGRGLRRRIRRDGA